MLRFRNGDIFFKDLLYAGYSHFFMCFAGKDMSLWKSGNASVLYIFFYCVSAGGRNRYSSPFLSFPDDISRWLMGTKEFPSDQPRVSIRILLSQIIRLYTFFRSATLAFRSRSGINKTKFFENIKFFLGCSKLLLFYAVGIKCRLCLCRIFTVLCNGRVI